MTYLASSTPFEEHDLWEREQVGSVTATLSGHTHLPWEGAVASSMVNEDEDVEDDEDAEDDDDEEDEEEGDDLDETEWEEVDDDEEEDDDDDDDDEEEEEDDLEVEE